MSSKQSGNSLKRKNNWILAVIIPVVALLILVPQTDSISAAFSNILNAYWPLYLLAVACWLTTYFTAAAVYIAISTRRLPIKNTLLVQVASGFTNRLIPAGAGALATNTVYLIKRGYNKTQATTVSVINNTIGFMASILTLALVALFTGQDAVDAAIQSVHISNRLIAVIVIITFLVLVFVVATSIHKRGLEVLKSINHQIENSFLDGRRLFLGLLYSLLVTLGYAGALHFSALALNIHMSLFQTVLVLTIGVLIATITPTPGGIGGAEAGLVGALSAIGVDIHQAISLAVAYRLITFWLPIIPGYIALNYTRSKSYL